MQRSRLLVTVPAEQGLRQATGSLIMTLGKNMKNSIRQVFLSEGQHAAVKKAMELDPKLTLIQAIEMVERIPKDIAEENKPKYFKPADSNPIDLSNISLGKGLLMILIGSIFFVGAMIYSSSKSPSPTPPPQASASSFPSSKRMRHS